MPTGHIKGAHYSNNLILSQEGKPLSTVGDDRIEWYLKRNLATELPCSPMYKRIIQLNFKHAGEDASDETDIMPMHNQCVVCGRKDTLSLHHVVPYSVKRNYPLKYKEHTRRQCVLLCEEHHIKVEELNKQLLENPYDWVENHIGAIHRVIGNYSRFLKRIAIKIWIWRKGGVKQINQNYIKHFAKMEPKHLPENWLQS